MNENAQEQCKQMDLPPLKAYLEELKRFYKLEDQSQ